MGGVQRAYNPLPKCVCITQNKAIVRIHYEGNEEGKDIILCKTCIKHELYLGNLVEVL